MSKHYDRLDNIRAILIFLVVFGHALERVSFPGRESLYLFIYSFHMPAFAFLSGLCFHAVDAGRLFRRYLYPYFVFQILYLMFTSYETGKDAVIQFTTPQHVLWYLLALIFWNAAVTLLHITPQTAPWLITASTSLALLAGFEPTVGRYLSLSRILVFFPFFLAGACIKELWFQPLHLLLAKPNHAAKAVCGAWAAALAVLCFHISSHMDRDWFYEACPYEQADAAPELRAALFAAAAGMIACLFFLVPARRLPILSGIGQHTMPVYLLHDFAVRLLAHFGWFSGLRFPLAGAFLFSAVLVFILSLAPVQHILEPLLQWPFSPTRQGVRAPAKRSAA